MDKNIAHIPITKGEVVSGRRAKLVEQARLEYVLVAGQWTLLTNI